MPNGREVREMEIEKAHEITDARIEFVSLVDKAANKRQFLIAKSEGGDAEAGTGEWQSYGKIIKADPETHHVTGVVYEPGTEDTQGDYMTAEEIEKACHWFAKHGEGNDIQHNFRKAEGVAVVESWIAKADCEIEGEPVKKGTWLMTVEIEDADIWQAIEKGDITGFSMGGRGFVAEEDTDPVEEKRGLLTKLAQMLGIEKGEVKDTFNHRSRGELFWEAWNVLEETLCSLGLREGADGLTEDPAEIREALDDFTQIAEQVLTEGDIVKALSGENATNNVAKAKSTGRALSGKDRRKLNNIYSRLGEFIDGLDEDGEAEGGESVTKAEVEEIVEEAIKKAMDGDEAEQAPEATPEAGAEEPAGEGEAAPEATAEEVKPGPGITAETVEKMVEEAMKKAMEGAEPKEEPVTAEQVQELIDSAVSKAVEPILKSKGLPSNLNGQEPAAPEKVHYLHGIL